MKISAKTITIGISTLIVVGGSVAYYLLTNDSPETLGWMNSSWLYRKGITVENEGDDLFSEDVLIEIDTASLISANKLQSDCDDLRFTDGDETTSIYYWIEGGCNTSTTQIWAQIPELRTGGQTIYMYYGNASATNSEQTWSSGVFTMMYNNTCPSGWTRVSALDGRFTYGATISETTGGNASHNHSISDSVSSVSAGAASTNCSTASIATTHNHSFSTNSSTKTDTYPPYVEMIFCSKSKLDISSGLIGIFDSAPGSGWTRFSALDTKFARGASSYGATGGAETHTHTYSTSTGGPSDTAAADTVSATLTRATSSHTHSVGGTTDSGTSLPPYIDVLFYSKDSTGVAVSSLISMASSLPPLGWTSVTAFDNKFLRGNSSYGSTGGVTTHTHGFSGTTGGSSNTTIRSISNCYSVGSHSHTYAGTSGSGGNVPPYTTIVYAKRKTTLTTTPGTEETQNTAPNAPSSLLTEGQTNPSSITDSTPEFSAVFSDTDSSDTGNYYQINVNTNSSFTGTSMWDSTKTALSPVVTNGSRSQDISYAGSTLSVGTIYYWRIKFWDNNTGESSWSSTANFTLNAPPTAPTSPQAEGLTNPTSVADTTPEFSAIFNDPNTGNTGVSYQIQVNTASDFTGTSMWDSTLTAMTATAIGARSPDISYAGTTLTLNGTTYYWRIRFADNHNETGSWSSAGSFVMDGAPFAPTGLLTDGMTNPIRIFSSTPYFSAIHSDPNGDDANIYQLQVNTNNTFTGTVMWDSGQQATSTPDGARTEDITYAGTPLTNENITYYWRIKFWDLGDYEGPWSATAQFSSQHISFLFEGLGLGGIKID